MKSGHVVLALLSAIALACGSKDDAESPAKKKAVDDPSTQPTDQGTGSPSGSGSGSGSTPVVTKPTPNGVDPAAAEIWQTSKSADCQDATIKTVVVKVDPQDPQSPQFAYKIRVLPGTDPKLPAIVYLPGGPGSDSIGSDRDSLGVPPQFTLVLTDPRGVGCNALEGREAADSFYGSRLFAGDVLAALGGAGVTDYVLWGISYGTLLATEIAALAETENRAPRAVVLEGTLGRAFTDEAEVLGTFLTEWERVKAMLPKKARDLLSSEPLPYGYDKAQWGNIIQTLLVIGRSDGVSYPEHYLALVGTSDKAEEDDLKGLLEAITAENPGAANMNRLYRAVACSEISDDVHGYASDFQLEGGELRFLDGLVCEGRPLKAKPYDSADLPSTAPVIYLQGERDPATPVWQRDYHSSKSKAKTKSFISFPEGGHGVRDLLLPCANQFWTAAASQGDLAKATETCPENFVVAQEAS